MTRPTPERIEEIRKLWGGTCEERDELLAEIDALNAENQKLKERIAKLREGLTNIAALSIPIEVLKSHSDLYEECILDTVGARKVLAQDDKESIK